MAFKKKSAGRKKTGKNPKRGEMVELRDGSPYWQIVFSLHGNRISKTSGTSIKREAEKKAKELWQEQDDAHVRIHGKRGVPTKQRDARLLDAVDWFWEHKAHKDRNAVDTKARLNAIVDVLGANTLLSEITDAHITEMITALEQHEYRRPEKGMFSDERVDAHVTLLRRMMNDAIHDRKFYLPDAPYWPRHTLATVPRTREAEIGEIDAMTSAWRLDMRPALIFLFESGLRLRNAVELKWSQVDLIQGVIRLKVKAGKSKRRPRRDAEKNRKACEIPITPVIAEILRQQEGKHPTAVFTFASTYTRRCPHSGERREMGMCYPLKAENFQTHWWTIRRGCGIKNLRIHDLRRTRGSWLYRATGDIKLVKEFLHHADIHMTESTYAHVTTEHVVRGLAQASAYEATLRERHAARSSAAAAMPAQIAETVAELHVPAGANPCQQKLVSDFSTTSSPSLTSISDARRTLQRLELNPRFKTLISHCESADGISPEISDLPGNAGNRTLRKANCRTIAEAKSPIEDRSGGWSEHLRRSRFAWSCEPYMDDPAFLISFVEALDRCFSGTNPATAP